MLILLSSTYNLLYSLDFMQKKSSFVRLGSVYIVDIPIYAVSCFLRMSFVINNHINLLCIASELWGIRLLSYGLNTGMLSKFQAVNIASKNYSVAIFWCSIMLLCWAVALDLCPYFFANEWY